APSQGALFVSERGFLVGEDGPWLDVQRRRLGELHVRALEAHGTACLGMGGTELPAAERVARRLIAEEPDREAGHRLLMESLAATGNQAAPSASTRTCACGSARSSESRRATPHRRCASAASRRVTREISR